MSKVLITFFIATTTFFCCEIVSQSSSITLKSKRTNPSLPLAELLNLDEQSRMLCVMREAVENAQIEAQDVREMRLEIYQEKLLETPERKKVRKESLELAELLEEQEANKQSIQERLENGVRVAGAYAINALGLICAGKLPLSIGRYFLARKASQASPRASA